MSTRMRARVGRLERAVGFEGPCRTCHGRGPPAQVLVWEKGKPKPEHPACPECGANPGPYKLIILEGADEA